MNATLAEVAATSHAVRATASRLKKQAHLASLFARLDASDLALAVSYLSGETPQGAIGVGWKAIAGALHGPQSDQTPPTTNIELFPTKSHEAMPAAAPDLTLAEMDRFFSAIAATRGAGSSARSAALLRDLFARAGDSNRDFLAALLSGELRQGALRAIVRDALARALDVPPEAIARAEMFGGDLALVAAAVRRDGPEALARFAPRPMVPVAPMLARSAETPAGALADLGPAAVETKIDGVRIQLHKEGDLVRVFTRQLRDVTASVPEIIEVGRTLAAMSAILDGEAVARNEHGRPLAFQDTMSRIGREDAAAARAARPLTALFFDLLSRDGNPLIDRPFATRWEALAEVTRGQHLAPHALVASEAELERFYAESLAAGHEGVVVKSLAALYAAGKRGGQWRKLKPATTLDLVILAAEWGHGRRRGYLSNLHLGARDPHDPERFWMLGKTFKGLTDEMLREMTADLLALAAGDPQEHVVRVRPVRVVEIAFDTVQRSPRYDSGLALRFARVKRFRPDKPPADATTIDEVRAIHARQNP
jgi:DNA ligase-1